MSKICNNCGNILEDDAVFCGNCGSMYTAAPVEEPVVEAPAEEAAPAPKKKLNLKTLIIAAAAGVVALIVLIVLLAGGGYKKAVKNLEKLYNGNGKVIEKMAPKDYWDEYDIDVDEMIEEYEDSYDEMVEYLEEKYGKNVKFKIKITDKEKMDSDDVKDLAKVLADKYDFIKKKDVKKAYELELEMTIKGKDDEDSNDEDVIAVKIKGNWYLISSSGNFIFGM